MSAGDARGLAMPEAMVAVLLFSLAALALLDYLQQLRQYQERLYQHQQALVLGHQALELYRTGLPASRLELPDGWRLSLTGQPRGAGCLLVSAKIVTPWRRSVLLDEWFCDGGDRRPAAQ